ncbi:MAG: hypothetical protein E4G96_08600 [Chrysiogenales bacterium]|nr:MAG: hypothetical protein E4G96_08600 [Chrysiogenales bacterium]
MSLMLRCRATPGHHADYTRQENHRVSWRCIHRRLMVIMAGSLLLSCGPVMNLGPVPEYRLEGIRAESWRMIKKDFYHNGFLSCLAEKKVTVSCAGCTGVILRGVIHVNREGQMSRFDRTYSRYCGDDMPPDVEKCLIMFFRSIEFPRELRGISLEVDLGRALKC